MYEFILLIKLVCAHFCSDFIFQTNKVHATKNFSIRPMEKS